MRRRRIMTLEGAASGIKLQPRTDYTVNEHHYATGIKYSYCCCTKNNKQTQPYRHFPLIDNMVAQVSVSCCYSHLRGINLLSVIPS